MNVCGHKSTKFDTYGPFGICRRRLLISQINHLFFVGKFPAVFFFFLSLVKPKYLLTNVSSFIIADVKSPRKRIKRIKSHINFDICCPINNDIIVPNNLLQICADEMEIKRRLNCFIERKREEIDINNVQDFIAENGADSTCARVNSTVHRVKGANTHLKVHRVKNEFGPQTVNYTNALDKLMANASPIKIKTDPDASMIAVPQTINERIVNAEKFLNEPIVMTKSIFERLKCIENRILYLEALSPEYGHFLVCVIESYIVRQIGNSNQLISNFVFRINQPQPMIYSMQMYRQLK